MAVLNEFTFPSADGKTAIRVRRWAPEGPVKGFVQIAHGIGEHVERYDGFMTFLAEHGYVAAANDHLGHGYSISASEELGYFAQEEGWMTVVRDMHTLQGLLTQEDPTLPAFLFGHSMGSFLARTYLYTYPTELTGAILCGTGHMSRAVTGFGERLCALTCRLRGDHYRSRMLAGMTFMGYNRGIHPVVSGYEWLSRDSAVVDAYLADPLCGQVPTAALLRDMLEGIRGITDLTNCLEMRKTLPVLFIAGERDPVGEFGKGVKRAVKAFETVGMEDVTLKLYPGCRHELLNELNRQEVMEDVLSWMKKRTPRPTTYEALSEQSAE